jgi:hypothetical protein
MTETPPDAPDADAPMGRATPRQWHTHDELDFLDGLGTHRPERRSDDVPRWYLYKQYLTAAAKRVEWGAVKASRACEHAQRRLEATRPSSARDLT